MLPRWDRIQIGPRYNLTDNLLGAYLGYAVMWDHFHLILGAQIENVLRPDGFTSSIATNVAAFWRF